MKFNQQITTQVYSIEEAGGVEFVEDRMKELKIQEISFVRSAPTSPSSESSSEESDQGGSLQHSMILEPVPTPPSSESSGEASDQGESLQSSIILEQDRRSLETPVTEHNLSRQASPDVVQQILDIIQGYSQNESNATGDAWLGRKGAESQVRTFVDASLPVDFCIPAFPWKSVNRVDKVLGSLPDLGEELALGRLQSLCEDIQDVYRPGAFVTVTSDGLVYNDAFGVPDEEVYIYGSALRQMATAKGFDRLKFMRMMNLLGLYESPDMTKEGYLATVSMSRKLLQEKYGDPKFDARDAILNDADINLTYRGYSMFLEKDLRHSSVTAGATSNRDYKRAVKRVAAEIITRGKAYAAVVKTALPHYVRLSIHRSIGLQKTSFPLVPQPDHFSMTPWHCCIAVTHKGEFKTAHAVSLRDEYDLISHKGQPYYFRDRDEVWNWNVPVEFGFFYPRGVYVKAVSSEGEVLPRLGAKEMEKVKKLRKGFQTVIVLGFA